MHSPNMSHDITQNGLVSAEKKVSLYADYNITMQDTVLHKKNQDVLHTTAGIAVKGKDGVLLMEAGNNIHLDTDTLEAKKDMTENSDNYIRTYRKTETTNTLAAGKTITLAAGENLSARNTTVLSENGQITAAAKGDVNLENGYNESRDDYGLNYKERGLLSHKTTTIESAEEKEQHTYDKQVKKSGLMGSGLGFTIGKEKRNDQYQEADTLQKASTVGSLQGNVSISSHHGTHVIAFDILAGKDISMTGENVTITSKDNVYHSDEKHEYKESGLTVSASGGAADILTDTIDYAKKAFQCQR